MASRFLLASVIATTMAVSAIASAAEPSAADKETARGLMTQGRTARDKGDMKAALKAFTAADALMHVPTTGLEVAKTQAAMGLLVEARDTALQVMRSPEKAGEPTPFKRAREAAAALNDEVESRIPSLTVNVKNVPEGATPTVTIDDTPVPSELLGQPRKLDPGHHVVVAKADSVDGKQEVDVAEKEKKEVTIELPAAAPAAATAATTPSTPAEGEQPSSAEQPEAQGKSGFSKGLMFGGFGLAGAGVIAGAVTGVMSMSKTSSIKSSTACAGTVCGPQAYDDISSARSMATISTVSFVVAGAGAVLGVVGLLTGNSSSPSAAPEKAPAEESSRVEPWLGLGAAGLRGTF